MSFHSDMCMISLSIAPFLVLLLIVWLPPYCCSMLSLWSRSRGGFPCSCQCMKQEPRGQGASLKDFRPLFSLFGCLNNSKHWRYCFVNTPVIVPHISLPWFVQSTDIGVYPQSPGAVERNSSLETLQSVTRWDAGTDAEMLRSWTGLGDGIPSVFLFLSELNVHFAPNSARSCLHSPAVTDKIKFSCCQVVFAWGHLINDGSDRASQAKTKTSQVVMTDITHPLLFMIMQYSVTTYVVLLFVCFSTILKFLHFFAWSLLIHP